MGTIYPLFVAVPLGAAFLLPLFGKGLRRHWPLDVFSGLIATGLFGLAMITVGTEPLQYWVGGWVPAKATGIAIVGDGLTHLLLVIINMVAAVSVLFSISYMKRYTKKSLYYSLFFLMVAGMNGVVITGDMFNLYVFLEVAAIASYALVAFGCESEELEASFKYLVLGSIGSTFILFGIAILYNQTGTLNMAQIANNLSAAGLNRTVMLAACFFFTGFGLKAAMVPFHAWLPDAHPSAPAPISAMLSGVLIKALGIYALCRVFFNVLGINHPGFSVVLMTMGVLSMVAGALLAVGQKDFKRLLAYSSISQMGYVVLAVGLGAHLIATGGSKTLAAFAIFGGLFHLFNHAVFKSLLFLCAGAVEYATGERDMTRLGGLARRMPVTSACCRIGALSISGIPPFNGFWSKLIIILALARAGHLFLASLTVAVSFVTLLYFVKVQRYVLHGELHPEHANVREVPVGMCTAMILLAIVCIGAGVLAPVLIPGLLDPARNALMDGVKTALVVFGG